MPLATFSGLASGIDSATLIKELVKIQRAPIDRIQQKQSDFKAVATKVDKLRDLLNALKTAAAKFEKPEDALISKVTSSDEKAVKATATGNAPLGSYEIEITALAKAERTHSTTFASKTAALNVAGDLDIQVGSGTAVTVSVAASDSLTTIAQKINASGAKVNASVIYDGTNYRLQVAGKDTGASNTIAFTEDPALGLGLDQVANQVVAAADAEFTVDGVEMTRSSNTVTDAIDGVTLKLQGLTGGTPASVTSERDVTASADQVQAFVDAYNAVVAAIKKEFSYTDGASNSNTLSGDFTLRTLQEQLRTTVQSVVSGGTSGFQQLAALGVTTQRDGTLKLDRTRFESAVTADPAAVTKLLSGDSSQGVTGLMADVTSLVDQYTKASTGLLVTKSKSFTDRANKLDGQIDVLERRVDLYETRLRAQFTKLETLISTLQGQGSQMSGILNSF